MCEGLTIIRVDRKQRAVRIEVSGGAAPRDRDLSPGRDIGISRTGRSGYSRYPKLQRLCSERNYSISSTRFNRVFTANLTSQLKNYRRNPEYKPCTKIPGSVLPPDNLAHGGAIWRKLVRKGLWEAEVPGA